MNKKLGLAVAGAVLAFASTANAGITVPAGDWTLDFGGNVNAFYTHTSFDDALELNGKANKGKYGSESANTVQTGLLPSAIGIGGKTRQNDLDVAFQFTFFVGTDSESGAAFGNNSLNIRQAFLTFGDASWGTIKMGRDLGIFGSDAILSDMTLLGVGSGAGQNGSTTLGRIGTGYQYADWKGQISYWSPNWNGFSFGVGITEGFANANDATNNNLGYEGKVAYEWAGDYAGKVWLGYINDRHEGTATAKSYTTDGWEIGGKVSVAGFGLVGYYYDGDGLSNQGAAAGNSFPGTLNGGVSFKGTNESDDNGGYIQGTYTIPGVGTKLGLSWGTSRSEAKGSNTEFENESWIVGAYHPLTKSLNLVAEYTDNELDNIGGVKGKAGEGEAKTISLGAFMFF